jgi:hypothetical protein
MNKAKKKKDSQWLVTVKLEITLIVRLHNVRSLGLRECTSVIVITLFLENFFYWRHTEPYENKFGRNFPWMLSIN